MNTLGNKIKVFRRLRGLSQLDLEVMVGSSSGVISRIESNVTNPSKETLERISDSLNLNILEGEYLYGSRSEPATQNEIDDVINKIKKYLDKPMIFGYVIDDRHRIVRISDSFVKLAKFTQKDLEYIYNKHLSTLVTYDESPIKKFFEKSDYENVLMNVFTLAYKDMRFMAGDESYEIMMREIKANEIASKYWNIASKLPLEDIRFNEIRNITFNYHGIPFNLKYSREPLWFNERFRLIEYTPNNILLKIYKSILHE